MLDHVDVLCILAQHVLNLVVARVVLQIVHIDHRRLVSEVPNVVLVVQYLAVEGHDRSIIVGLGERFAHVLPNLVQAERSEDAASANLFFQLVECTVDEVLEHRQLGLYLGSVLAVEVNHGLHARRLAIQAPAVFAGLLNIQVMVKALIELLHDLLKTFVAQEITHTVGIELIGHEFNDIGHVVHSAVSVALQVSGL